MDTSNLPDIEVKTLVMTSSHDGGMDKHTSPPRTTTAKITTRLQNKYHPDSLEKGVVWKLDNQEFLKQQSFWQVGGSETWRCMERCGEVERRGHVERMVPYLCVVDKNQERYLRSMIPVSHQTTQPRVLRKPSPHNFWLQKPVGVGVVEETAGCSAESF